MGRRGRFEGAAPDRALSELDSDVYHLDQRMIEAKTSLHELDDRVRKVEETVSGVKTAVDHMGRQLWWIFGLVSASVIGAVAELLSHAFRR